MNADKIRAEKLRKEKKAEKAMLERMKREEAALFATIDESQSQKKKRKQQEEAKEEKIELDDDTLLDQCAPDELDELIDRLVCSLSLFNFPQTV